MGRLTASAISTTYKDLVFQKTDNKIYYTNGSDVDTEITTFATPMTFSGKITASLGIELDNNIIYASDGGTTITLDTSDNVAITGDLIVTGNDIKSGNISSSTTAITLSGANAAIAGDLTVSGNDIKSNGGTTAITLSSDDVTVAGDLTVTGTSSGKMTLGADADGTDRSIVFGHTTLKSIMGIDDSADVFAINTDAAFEGTNDFSIDASGNVAIKGDLTITGGNITNALTLNSTLAVTNTTTFNNNILINGAYDIRFVKANGMDIHDGSAAYLSVVNDTVTIAKALTCSSTSIFTGNTGPTVGAGFSGTGTVYKSWFERYGTVIKTTILVDITGTRHSAAGDIIGDDGTANPCHIGRITAASNGSIFSGRMTCLEAPTVADMDLYSATEGTGAEDTAISTLTEKQTINGGNQSLGTVSIFDNGNLPAANDYLYLVCQSAGDADYAAGKFLIELWGTV
tara:strand:- start:720 stop:2093 length:1374 start_codon:yes stop_codon:yes gene_type:complete